MSICVSFSNFYLYNVINKISNKGSGGFLSTTLIGIIGIIRYLVSGWFAFSIFNNSNDSKFTKIFLPSLTYAATLAIFKFFVVDSPLVTVISALAIFGLLALKNKLKAWKISLTYSLFITCLMEYIHFIIFALFSISIETLGIAEVTANQPERLLISRGIVLILYTLALLLIYKVFKTEIKSVSKFSNYTIFPVFLILVLCMIIYLKYYIKYTHSNQFHNILSIIFVFFIASFLIFIFSSKFLLDIIENFEKKKINSAIEEAKLKKGKGYAGLKFTSEKLNSEFEYFQNELLSIHMDVEDKKSKQICFCAVLLNHEEIPENVNISRVIYPCVANILDRLPKSIDSNIGNALQNHWNSSDFKTLKKIEENYHIPISEKNGAPTPREFLLYLVNKYRKDNPSYNNTDKIKFSFLKKIIENIKKF